MGSGLVLLPLQQPRDHHGTRHFDAFAIVVAVLGSLGCSCVCANLFCGQAHLRGIFGDEFDDNISIELEDGTVWTADMDNIAFKAPDPVRSRPHLPLVIFWYGCAHLV